MNEITVYGKYSTYRALTWRSVCNPVSETIFKFVAGGFLVEYNTIRTGIRYILQISTLRLLAATVTISYLDCYLCPNFAEVIGEA